jgi:hypothetical protein
MKQEEPEIKSSPQQREIPVPDRRKLAGALEAFHAGGRQGLHEYNQKQWEEYRNSTKKD